MAIYDDERRSARDYMQEARMRSRQDGGSAAGWIGATVFLLLIGFVFVLFLAAPSQDPTDGITRSPAETAPTRTVPQSPTPSPTAPTTQPR